MEQTRVRPSVGQTLLWFLDRYRGEEGALNCPVLCRVRGPLDTGVLRAALADVTARHESLRTTFTGGGRRLTALVASSVTRPVTEADLSGTEDPEQAVHDAVAAELGTRIDPAEDAVRVTLWRLGADHHVLCLNMHHMVTDSWSCNVVFQDLCAALDRHAGIAPEPGAEPLPYSQFAEQQRRDLSGPSGKRLSTYWARQLEGFSLPPLPMRPATAGLARDTTLVQDVLDERTVGGLRELARDQRATLFSVLLTAYYRALQKASGADGTSDWAVATLFANRSAEYRRTVGFLANMVLLRTHLARGASFTEHLRATQATVMDAFVHQALPFQMLPISLADAGRRPDDVVFQMMAEPVYSARAGGLELAVLVPDDVATRFELELVAVPDEHTVRILLFFNPDRFSREFADALLRNYLTICTAAAGQAARTVTGRTV